MCVPGESGGTVLYGDGWLGESGVAVSQWAAGGFEEFLNIMNFYVFLIVWDNRVNKL